MPSIYLATPKNTEPSIDRKLKYVVVKDNTVEILNKKQYNADSSRDFTFLTGKSNAKELKKHIEKNIESLNIDHSIKFLELLKDKFDIQEQHELRQEGNVQVESPTLDEEEKNLPAPIPCSQPPNPLLPRTNSVKHDNTSENASLRKTSSFLDLSDQNLPKMSRSSSSHLSSAHDSISQDSLENSERTQLIDGAQKIRSFFTDKEHNNNLANIERHGLNIKGSYFNGNGKSKILLHITELAAQTRNSVNKMDSEPSSEQILGLKQNISKLDEIINDKQNLDALSRYRGFSPFKCFATFWGGGRVKSIEYVKQLREQLNTLTKEIAPIIPTV